MTVIKLEEEQKDLMVKLCGKVVPKTWEDRFNRILDLLEDRKHKIDVDGYGPIWISRVTRLRLKEFSKKNEFWDDLLWRLTEIVLRPLDLSDVLSEELIIKIDAERIEPMLSREEFIQNKINSINIYINREPETIEDDNTITVAESEKTIEHVETHIQPKKIRSKESDLISAVERFKRG